MDNTKLLKQYVKALIQNTNRDNIPKKIDVVFDGGAFNGFFSLGTAIYLSELRNQGHIKINRVSGCSIGALVALYLFLIDTSMDFDDLFSSVALCLRTNNNLNKYHSMVRDSIMRLVPDDNMDFINGRLFVNFYDFKKKKKRTVSKYRNREHLVECIIRSAYVPCLMDGNLRYKKRYIDGITPFIFNKSHDTEIVFVQILTLNKLHQCIPHRTEVNPHGRILAGVVDANEFFIHGKSDMCSYVGKWSITGKLTLYVREVIIIFIHSILELLVMLHAKIPNYVTDSILYNGILNILKELYTDAARRIL